MSWQSIGYRVWLGILLGYGSLVNADFREDGSSMCGIWARDASLGGGLEALAAVLYAKPHSCDLQYVIQDPRSHGEPSQASEEPIDRVLPLGRQLGICPSYEFGFRVGIGYFCRCSGRDWRLVFTRLSTRDVRRISADGMGGLWITDGHPRFNDLRLNNPNVIPPGTVIEREPLPARTRARFQLDHNRFDVVKGWQRCLAPYLWVRQWAGLLWMDVSLIKEVDYEGTTTTVGTVTGGATARVFQNHISRVEERSSSWGVGPILGAETRLDLLGGFGVQVRGSVGVLAGQRRLKEVERVRCEPLLADIESPLPVDERIDLSFCDARYAMPLLDLRLGMTYRVRCGNWFYAIASVGWEFMAYFKVLRRFQFNHLGGTNAEVCDNFGIDGLYISLRISL